VAENGIEPEAESSADGVEGADGADGAEGTNFLSDVKP